MTPTTQKVLSELHQSFSDQRKAIEAELERTVFVPSPFEDVRGTEAHLLQGCDIHDKDRARALAIGERRSSLRRMLETANSFEQLLAVALGRCTIADVELPLTDQDRAKRAGFARPEQLARFETLTGATVADSSGDPFDDVA